MKENNIDNILKGIIENNDEYFKPDAMEAKDRIWNKAKLHIPNSQKRTTLIQILSAACIGLLVLSSVSLNKLKIERNENQQLTKSYTSKLKLANNSNSIKIDTLFIEKHYYDTVVKTIKIEVPKVEYITEVVHITDTVFQTIEKIINEENYFIANNEKIYKIEKYDVPKDSKVKTKNISFRFGGRDKELKDTRLAIRN